MLVRCIRFLRRPATIAVFAVLAVAGGAGSLARAATIDEDLSAAIAALEKLVPPSGDTAQLIKRLRDKLDQISKCTPVECKLNLLEEFSQAIKDGTVTANALTPNQVQAVLGKLAALAQLGREYQVDLTAEKLSEAIQGALAGKDPQQAGKGDAAPIKDAIETLQKWQSPEVAATERANELKTVLTTRKPKRDDQALGTALTALTAAIAKFEKPDQSATDRVKELSDLIEQWNDKTNKKAFDDGLKPLSGKISTFLEPTASATLWAGQLEALLKQAPDKRPKDTPELKQALKTLVAAIQSFPDLKGPFLNIVAVLYGDLHDIDERGSKGSLFDWITRTGPRFCDATTEVRDVCQAKAVCPFEPKDDAGAKKLEFTGARLCGEDPVPTAKLADVGAVIEYECLYATKAEWDRLQKKPTPTKKWEERRKAELRSGTPVTVRCQAAVSE